MDGRDAYGKLGLGDEATPPTLDEALAAATEAVVIDRFDAERGTHSAYSLLHDGATAVVAGGGPEKEVVSAPLGLDDVIADLALEIGGRIDEGPPRTARIGALAVAALQAALGTEREREREAASSRLRGLIEEMELDAEPEQLLAALEEDRLLSRAGQLVTAGPVLLTEPAVSAAIEGSTLEITRMSLSGDDGEQAHDVRTLRFAGPAESRFLVLPADEEGQIGLARLTVPELTLLLSSHLIGRAEPATVAAAGESRARKLPPFGSAAELTASDLVAAAGGGDGEIADTARALLAPPSAIALRSADGSRDAAEGIAIWDSGVVAWSWALGAGHSLVEPLDSLTSLTAAMLAGRVEAGEREPLLLSASTWTERGLEYAGAEIAVEDGGFAVLRAAGIELPEQIDAETLAKALLARWAEADRGR